MKGTCHCGAVVVTTPGPPPYMNKCNCSLCSKSGGVWGYYQSRDVSVVGTTLSYRRKDLADPAIDNHFCAACGSSTHWTLTPEFAAISSDPGRMGVNMRLFDIDELVGVEIRYPDGRSWDGTSSDYGYSRAPTKLAKGEMF